MPVDGGTGDGIDVISSIAAAIGERDGHRIPVVSGFFIRRIPVHGHREICNLSRFQAPLLHLHLNLVQGLLEAQVKLVVRAGRDDDVSPGLACDWVFTEI